MRYTDYLQELDKSKEYRNAEDELKIHFELAKAVVRARINKGWSQEELAEKIGTKQANISRIESGLANPTIKIVQKLMKVLGIEIKFVEFEESKQGQVSVQTKDIVSIEVANWPIRNKWKQKTDLTNRSVVKEI